MDPWPTLGLREAQTILKPRMPLLAACLRESLDSFNDIPPLIPIAFTPATKWACLNDLWYSSAEAKFSETAGVSFGAHKPQRYLNIGERCLLRYKHFDKAMFARNYPTRHNRDWLRQGHLMGLPPAVRLELGYRLDGTGIRFQDAFITLPFAASHQWVWQIWGAQIETFAIPRPLFADSNNELLFAYDDYSQTG